MNMDSMLGNSVVPANSEYGTENQHVKVVTTRREGKTTVLYEKYKPLKNVILCIILKILM